MIAFALVRYRFRGRSTTNLIIFLPMATPEVVMGSSLLALFLNLRFPLGSVTVAIAHIMFIISFVVVGIIVGIGVIILVREQWWSKEYILIE